MKETTLRTTARGFGWRIIVFLTSYFLTLALTGNAGAAILVGSIECVVKLFVYVQYEKAFYKFIKFGIKDGKPTVKRTITKGLAWRVIASMMAMTITYFVTGDGHSAGVFGLIAFPLKFSLYVMYEQLVWKKIEWGFVPKPIQQVTA